MRHKGFKCKTLRDNGPGLGLSISYGIVEQHGGAPSVRNHPDGGAEFLLELPLAGVAAGS